MLNLSLRFKLVAVLVCFSAASRSAELVCPLGKPDFTASDRTAQEIAQAGAALKVAAKSNGNDAETARAQRLELAYEAIESALKNEAINQMAKAQSYWAVAEKDLGDTKWRMGHEAKQGNVRARWLVLESQLHQKNADWDEKSCLELEQAANLSTASVLYRRAICRSKNDPGKGLQLMEQAARAGHPAAMEAYGRLCADQGDPALGCAVEWLCQAADAGRSSAAGLAAYLLTSKTPTPAQAVKAAALYEMALSAGDLASANNLGELYELGWIGRPNPKQAVIWYRKAAEAGIDQAKLNLARMIWRDAAQREEAKSLIESASVTMPAEAKQLLQQLERTKG